MKPAFANTSFYLALLNPRDVNHARARRLAEQIRRRTVVSDFVLVEVGNAVAASPQGRDRFLILQGGLQRNPDVTIVPASRELLLRGVQRYEDRRDKQWSLTDCISFVLMEELELTEALTADRRFEQAGFVRLLG
jgi:hypothetical protein